MSDIRVAVQVAISAEMMRQYDQAIRHIRSAFEDIGSVDEAVRRTQCRRLGDEALAEVSRVMWRPLAPYDVGGT